MNSLPELFDRQFQEAAKGYFGRADFDLDELEVRRLCRRLHRDVNASLVEQSQRIVGAHKTLYFDIIKSEKINASSKACGDETYLIGVTQRMVSRVREALLRLTSEKSLYTLVGIQAEPMEINKECLRDRSRLHRFRREGRD